MQAAWQHDTRLYSRQFQCHVTEVMEYPGHLSLDRFGFCFAFSYGLAEKL